MLLDYGTIIYRAGWVRHRAGLVGTEPPYSTRHILETLFPDIPVSGAALPDGVTEMAVVRPGGRALFYNRNSQHTSQRVGLMHGLYHHLSDLKGLGEHTIRECNIPFRKLTSYEARRDPVELACDLFAAEVLVPLDVLDDYAPDLLYSNDPVVNEALKDEADNLSSRFNVPNGFMRWRLRDLQSFRKTHFNPEF